MRHLRIGINNISKKLQNTELREVYNCILQDNLNFND